MIRTVEGRRYVGATAAGGSGATILQCAFEDSLPRDVVVKFKENNQGGKVLVNELVAGLLAMRLGVCAPDPLLVSISLSLSNAIANSPGVRVRGVSPGLHFGVPYLDNPVPSPPADLFNIIDNKKDVPLLIVFDVLCYNTDRNNAGNFILHRPPPGDKLLLAAIDHGHCFGGPQWDETIISRVNTSAINLWPAMADLVIGKDPFREALSRLPMVTADFLKLVVESVPGEWGCPSSCLDALCHFILERTQVVEGILDVNRHLFRYWG